MKDYREIQRESARRERRALIAENVTFEQFRNNCKKYPAGSIWAWALDAVYGPKDSAGDRKSAS